MDYKYKKIFIQNQGLANIFNLFSILLKSPAFSSLEFGWFLTNNSSCAFIAEYTDLFDKILFKRDWVGLSSLVELSFASRFALKTKSRITS